MQSTFKRHQKVRLLASPDPEYIEYYSEEPVKLERGMIGKINIMLPNGKYHVEISGKNGEPLAYVSMDESALENAE